MPSSSWPLAASIIFSLSVKFVDVFLYTEINETNLFVSKADKLMRNMVGGRGGSGIGADVLGRQHVIMYIPLNPPLENVQP